ALPVVDGAVQVLAQLGKLRRGQQLAHDDKAIAVVGIFVLREGHPLVSPEVDLWWRDCCGTPARPPLHERPITPWILPARRGGKKEEKRARDLTAAGGSVQVGPAVTHRRPWLTGAGAHAVAVPA